VSAWAILQHVPFEGPGLIAEVAADLGLDVRVRRMDLGHPLPDVEELSGLIVLGGPMGALDDAAHPHLASERQLLAESLARDLPVLGVCLGAQLIAAALGASVYRGPAPEIGLGTAKLTPSGRRDPVLGPAGPILRVLHWHGDTFTLPGGAQHLAYTDTYAHQAFRVGRAYGLQFHVETNRELLDGFAPHLPAGVILDRRHAALVERSGRQILQRFFASASTPWGSST